MTKSIDNWSAESGETRFESWGLLELFGHQRLAGRISDQTIGGVHFLRIDVPEVDGTPGYSRFFTQGAIYGMTPMEEAVARALAKRLRATPVDSFTLREIPLTKCIHVVADDSEGSPEGRGVLRSMYRYWYMVTQFELLFGIALERFGTGLPVFERVDQTVLLTPEQEADILTQAEALRQNEQAGLLLPWGLKFSFADSPGLDAQTYLGAIQAYRTWMLTTGLAEFIALGTGETGSRALGSSKIDLFLKALTGLQDRICEAINRQAIPRLLRANGITAAAPTVSLPPVREYDVKAIADFLEVAGRAGVFHPTPEDEQWLRKVSDAPDLDLERVEALFGEAEAQAAADGAKLSCSDRGFGGFPFRFSFECLSPDVSVDQPEAARRRGDADVVGDREVGNER